MFVISFGNRRGLDQYELEAIASNPHSTHLLHQDKLDPEKVTFFPWNSSTSRYACTDAQSTTVPTTSTPVPTTSTTQTSSTFRPSSSSTTKGLWDRILIDECITVLANRSLALYSQNGSRSILAEKSDQI